MRYNISIGYDTAGFFFVSSSNIHGLKVEGKTFKSVLEKATKAARRLLGKPFLKLHIQPGVMVRNSRLRDGE